ncbi:hypothetical protein HOO54_03190 [Bacillus sp. WMMC1349]|uniref:hypothetical protein n=1 Tax=Bacillus sp. WMMC1349 TaxID=2736254 RepID=UPI00155429AF|nr:hypothetical protein [Bacillus sp. WMMC1349]NPC90729.1 hypothetical protein [Bacillus sp. WMMC1349]NPC91277.1 hypothetical protein [Bacillus sp. WMMC1349]
MKIEYTFKLENEGFYIPKFTSEFKLIELMFEDMAAFGEAIFKEYIEKVINGESNFEEIYGNICALEISLEFTKISTEFVSDGLANEISVETRELLNLINKWIEKNDL